MTDDPALSWEYSLDGHGTSMGKFYIKEDAPQAFSRLSFRDMLVRLQELLLESELRTVRVVRPGAKRTTVFFLDGMVVRAILRNVDEALALLTWTQDAPGEKKLGSLRPGIRAGLSTMADSFGDEVYILGREEELECPFCGRWVAASLDFRCSKCARSVALAPHGRWYAAKVKELLATKAEQFFLPRRWNKGNTWASREELQELFNKWQKVKEN